VLNGAGGDRIWAAPRVKLQRRRLGWKNDCGDDDLVLETNYYMPEMPIESTAKFLVQHQCVPSIVSPPSFGSVQTGDMGSVRVFNVES
jgi:hypothetical protein